MQNKASTTSNNIVLKLDTRDTSMGYDEPWDKQKGQYPFVDSV